jgi:hypothetical protein
MLVEIHIENKPIITVDWPQVPDEGERLVIDGTTYKVHSRKWYIYNSNLPTFTASSEVHIFLKEI